ncbi:MAG: Gfo/Idh/MocA family oxidoreductase, partial [Fimbriimonadaceae bacterium]|nr:Gfo/Idh/MocA family oxidoreductase [Fimbriimonadaceae bacterium]
TLTKRAHPALEHCPAFSDHQEMLAAIRPHAVVIGSPHSAHLSQAVDSFAAGAHVLVEKPLGNTVAECRAIIEARDKSGKVGAIAYQRHSHQVFREIKSIFDSGVYGRLLMMNSHLSQGWLKGTRGSWRQDPRISGGGQIHDSGSHMVDILLWMSGLQAKTVSAQMDFRGVPVDINSVVNIVFDSGALGSLSIIGDAPMWQERHSFWFEKAAVQYNDGEIVVTEDSGKKLRMEFPGHSFSGPDANFIAAIRGEAEVLAPFECGLKTMALTEAAWKSHAQQGAPVTVDLV